MTASDTVNLRNDIIDLSVGDHDIFTDQRVIDAAARNNVIGHTLYTHPLGDPKFRDIIVKSIKEDYNCKINLENIIVTIGAGHALYLALQGIVNEGDEILVIAPYYPAYIDQISSVDGNIVLVKTSEENGFISTIEDIEEKVTHKTKAIIINSPNNPTGAIYPKSLLEGIYKLSIENNFMVLSDEVYTAFTYDDNKFVSMLEIDKDLTNTIVFKSMSKDYAMTGWRIGYMISSEEIINISKYINDGITYSAPTICQEGSIEALKLRKEISSKLKGVYNDRIKYAFSRVNKIDNTKYINDGITYSAPTICQEGSIEALKLRKEISSKLKGVYNDRIKYAFSRVNKIDNIDVKSPQGCIYLFINIEKTGLDGVAFSNLLLENGVLVLPGDIFGSEYKNYIRLTCNKDIKILEEAFDRIEKIGID